MLYLLSNYVYYYLMRIRISRIDDRPDFLPLPVEGVLEFVAELKPTYMSLPDGRAYAEMNYGEYVVILDGTVGEFKSIAEHYTKQP